MNQKVILLQNLDVDQLSNLMGDVFDARIKAFQENQINKPEDLITSNEASDFYSVHKSTLWRWEKLGRIKVYKIVNKNYYKKSELLEALSTLNK